MSLPTSGAFDSLIGSTDAPSMADRVITKAVVDLLASEPDGAGLQRLARDFADARLDAQFRSWIGSGPRLDVSPADLKKVGTGRKWFPPDWADRVRSAAELASSEEVYVHLARVLPNVVGAFTPRGVVPSNPVVEYGLESMRKQLTS